MSGFPRLLSRVLLPAFVLLGCGGGGGQAPPRSPFSVAPAAISLYVPADRVDNLPAYSGTVTVTVNRDPGFTGTVTLGVDPARLPSGVKVDFAAPVLAAGVASDTVSVQAGSPDASFGAQTYPAVGSYAIPISAAAAGYATVTGTLTLHVLPEPGDFGLSFITRDAGGQPFLDSQSNLPLVAGTPLTQALAAYVATGSLSGSATLGAQGVPSGWTVSFAANPVALDAVTSVSFTAPAGQTAGIYSFQLTATLTDPATGQPEVRLLPVVATYSPAPFCIQPPASAQLTLAPGASLAFPVHLWHDDTFFDGTALDAGGDPAYLGDTRLAVDPATLPAGLQAAFADPDPTGLASSSLQLSADPALAPGTYQVNLLATRVEAGPVAAAPVTLAVTVPAPGDPAKVWLQDTEWAQSVVAPNLRLLAGKPALLRVLLLADRPGVALAAPLTATVQDAAGLKADAVLPLAGPAEVPTSVAEGDLPAGAAPAASSYSVLVPGADLYPGMRVLIQGGGLAAPVTLSPAVDPGSVLKLTAVRILHHGLAPELPDPAVMTREILAFWPVTGVDLDTSRAPYTTATVVPSPPHPGSSATDASAAGWEQLVGELATLRLTDGSTRDYYGFFNPGLDFPVSSTIVGLSFLGVGAGIGIDESAARAMIANGFANEDPDLDLATTVMAHELGHALNLRHTPGGGAGSPQLDYPYKGGSIGSWGYDLDAQAGHDPAVDADLMSYVTSQHWVSDWNYMSAMGFLSGLAARAGLAGERAPAESEQWVVSGWVSPDGQPHLLPLVRTRCVPQPPAAGDLRLVLSSAAGARSIPFSATQVQDLPAGHRHFCFTVPAGADLTGAEVVSPATARSFRRLPALGRAVRALAVTAAAEAGTLVVRETADRLHLEWDAETHPYLTVFHEGARRTTLALHLTGGSADLVTTGLPAGGRFVLHYSDGLNPIVLSIPR